VDHGEGHDVVEAVHDDGDYSHHHSIRHRRVHIRLRQMTLQQLRLQQIYLILSFLLSLYYC
jgi:hypothetical protein